MDLEKGNAIDYEIINGRKVIKKHVATIHCSNKLSLLERKISNALLFHAIPKLTKELTYEITIDELRRLLDFNSNNTKVLKDALKSLISTVIEWNLLGDDAEDLEGWNATTILASVSFKKGACRYQYSEILKNLLIDPKVYGRVNLIIQARFKSSYGLALYENCVRYRGLPQTKRFPYETFRKLMGVQENQYLEFKYFNRRVLSPAVEEVNVRSDITITPEIKKKGRKVESIMFMIKERPMKQRIGTGKENTTKIQSDNELVALLSEKMGFEPEKIAELERKFGKEKLLLTYEYVKNTGSYKTGKITSLTGYFLSSLTEGYKVRSSQEILKLAHDQHQQQKIQTELVKESLAKKQAVVDDFKKHYTEYKIRYMNNLLENLNGQDKNEIITSALNEMKSINLMGKKIAEEFLSNNKISIRSLYVFERLFAERKLLSGMLDIVSYEK